jgi:hypothetical protein
VCEDPAGQRFLTACSIRKDEAYTNLIRANAAGAKFGIGHPLRFRSKARMQPYETLRVSRLATQFQYMSQRDRELFEFTLAMVFVDAGLGHESTVNDVTSLALSIDLGFLPEQMPLDVAFVISTACREGLTDILAGYPETYQQQAVFLLGFYLANEDFGKAQTMLPYYQHLAASDPQLMSSNVFLRRYRHGTWERLSGPFWKCFIAYCFGRYLNFQNVAVGTVTALRASGLPLDAALELRISDLGDAPQFHVMPQHLITGDDDCCDDHGSIVISCTMRSISDAFITDDGPGMPVSPVWWRPRALKKWLDLQSLDEHDGHNSCNPRSLFSLENHRMRELDGSPCVIH